MTHPLVKYLREPIGRLMGEFNLISLPPKQGVPLFSPINPSDSVSPRLFFNLLDMRIIYSKLSWTDRTVPTAFTVTTVHTVLSPLVVGLTQSLLIKGDCYVPTSNN